MAFDHPAIEAALTRLTIQFEGRPTFNTNPAYTKFGTPSHITINQRRDFSFLWQSFDRHLCTQGLRAGTDGT